MRIPSLMGLFGRHKKAAKQKELEQDLIAHFGDDKSILKMMSDIKKDQRNQKKGEGFFLQIGYRDDSTRWKNKDLGSLISATACMLTESTHSKSSALGRYACCPEGGSLLNSRYALAIGFPRELSINAEEALWKAVDELVRIYTKVFSDYHYSDQKIVMGFSHSAISSIPANEGWQDIYGAGWQRAINLTYYGEDCVSNQEGHVLICDERGFQHLSESNRNGFEVREAIISKEHGARAEKVYIKIV